MIEIVFPHRHCETLQGSWQSTYKKHRHCETLKGSWQSTNGTNSTTTSNLYYLKSGSPRFARDDAGAYGLPRVFQTLAMTGEKDELLRYPTMTGGRNG